MGRKMEAPGAALTPTEGKSKAAVLNKNDTSEKPSRQQKWRKRNPAKYLAHLTVSHAQRLRLLKSELCAVCGDKRTAANHADTSRSLDVEWLCRRHHSAAYKKTAR